MRNHLGEREYKTYAAWKRAILKIAKNAIFEGETDLMFAFHPDTRLGIGEWYGDTGCIYLANDDDYIPKDF